jgi:hypothetical protein
MKPQTVITDYVLAHMAEEPVPRRIELTLALAEIAPTREERAALTAHADELREIEAHHRQILHTFRAAHPPAL